MSVQLLAAWELLQEGKEHRRNPVQTGALFLGVSFQHGFRLKGFAGKNHGRTVGEAGKVGH